MVYVVIRAYYNDYEILGVFNSPEKLKSFLKKQDTLDNVYVDKTFINLEVVTSDSKPGKDYV